MTPDIEFTVVLAADGTIAIGPIEPHQYEPHRESTLRMMCNVGSPVVETECIEPSEVDAITSRLVALLKGSAL